MQFSSFDRQGIRALKIFGANVALLVVSVLLTRSVKMGDYFFINPSLIFIFIGVIVTFVLTVISVGLSLSSILLARKEGKLALMSMLAIVLYLMLWFAPIVLAVVAVQANNEESRRQIEQREQLR